MEIIENIIQTTLNSFDFTYCIIVNILTYFVVKIVTDAKKDKHLTIWAKRGILLSVILSTGVLEYFIGNDSKLILNSAVLAPVFWSWIMKPICKHFNIDYANINIVE